MAVENNYLSATEAERKGVLERKEKAGTLTADEAKELADTRKLDKDRDQAIRDICTQGNKSGAACSALVAQAQQALNSYGESAASYRLIFKDLYPEDAANASAILKGLDEGSITRDAAITAIAKATEKDWNEVAARYDRVMQLHGMVSTLAGVYGMKSTTSSPEKGNSAVDAEKAALERIGQNSKNTPDLSTKEPNSVYYQQLIKNAENISTAKPGQQFTEPRDLNERLLWDQVKASPSTGEQLRNMNNDPRFSPDAGFQKMQVTHELPDGTNITIHYQYNANTGKAYDMKITTPKRSEIQPGPSLTGKDK
nr:hypothetical protein [Dickeya undicola]